MNDQERLREYLKKMMDERRLSLREVGRMSDIDHATLSKILNGKRKANLNHLQRLSAGMGVRLSELLSADDENDRTDGDLAENLKAVQKLVETIHPETGTLTMAEIDDEIQKYIKESKTVGGKQDILEKTEDKISQSPNAGTFMKNIHKMYGCFITGKSNVNDTALMGGALLYFIVTTDLIPDYLLPIGLLDYALIVQAISQRMENKNLLI